MPCPASTVDIISKINRAIQRLHDSRIVIYEGVSAKYHNIRPNYFESKGKTKQEVQHFVFEAFISSDMRHELEIEIDPSAVFMEFPGLDKTKIDIYVEADDAHAYVENKMYYSPGSDGPDNDYRKDFEKVKSLLDLESSMQPCVGFLVHCQLYKNRNFPAHGLYEKFASELNSTEWWSEIKCTGDRNEKHFVSLIFGKNE